MILFSCQADYCQPAWAMSRLLVIEDNVHNMELLVALLEELYQLETATNGEEALEKCHSFNPDLILADISLPVMDGVEFLKRLREIPRFDSVPVIAVTAFAMRGDREKYLHLGFSDYISKPINSKSLFQCIADLLVEKTGK